MCCKRPQSQPEPQWLVLTAVAAASFLSLADDQTNIGSQKTSWGLPVYQQAVCQHLLATLDWQLADSWLGSGIYNQVQCCENNLP